MSDPKLNRDPSAPGNAGGAGHSRRGAPHAVDGAEKAGSNSAAVPQRPVVKSPPGLDLYKPMLDDTVSGFDSGSKFGARLKKMIPGLRRRK